MASLSDFHAALRSLVDELGKQEIHLSELGLHIRRKLPRFTAESYGYPSFTELLSAAKDIGVLRFGQKSEDRWFIFGDVVQPASVHHEDFEIAEAIWNACVDIDQSRQGWLDLADCVHVETDAHKVADERERYLEMPRFDGARQLELLQSFAEGKEDETRAALLAIGSGWSFEQRPYKQLLQELQRLGLRHAWFRYLRQAVEGELRAWVSEHGVPVANLFKHSNTAAGAVVPAALDTVRTFEMDEHQLRAFLKAAIDEMTLAELGQWPVPARLLLAKRR
ncbi:OST-HTH/LOTUS domain-containing protein [Enhygromyxa salina]|uniref:OST-HTH/LOTUS domain protein n=1 Tax=Enhygromyxa salina TaxID=215803 RepID=A0A2S9XS40_9BACT|nr:OST-HTH/LOTUS domain-containing protein [Enhygromyxa salina]PRP95684.1 OST-HTH/LOTUS domain protein [Enhygromyxa salina]